MGRRKERGERGCKLRKERIGERNENMWRNGKEGGREGGRGGKKVR